MARDDRATGNLPVGTRVQVRNRFDGAWSSGFEVHGAAGDGYLVRRVSDARVIPTPFDPGDLRPRS